MLGHIDSLCIGSGRTVHQDGRGAFQKGLYKVPTIILEAVASYDTWIWHTFFCLPGSLNDINVLDQSPIFQELYENRAPTCEYVINGHKYNIGYFLSDGIYPQWVTFVKTIPFPQELRQNSSLNVKSLFERT